MTDGTSTTRSTGGGPAAQQLSAGELAALRSLLATQNLLGQGAPAFTASSVMDLMARLDALSAAYPDLVNATVRGWVDQLYESLTGADTAYAQKFPALYLTWQVSRFPFNPTSETVSVGGFGPITVALVGAESPSGDWNAWPTAIEVGSQVVAGVYPAFANPSRIVYTVQEISESVGIGNVGVVGQLRQPWQPTANPPVWNQALRSLLGAWGVAGAPVSIFPHCSFIDYVPKHQAVLDPLSWTDVEHVKDAVAPVWHSQLAQTRTLLAEEQLSGATYLFLLHLLMALTGGDDDCQALAASTLDLPCSPPAYPNDVFSNQLVYAALMEVSDPSGAFAWESPRRLQILRDLRSLTTGQDPASQSLQGTLDAQIRLQDVDPSYPMQDPNNSGTSFDRRKTDTLAALDASRRQALDRVS
jgi:hypothetical protein